MKKILLLLVLSLVSNIIYAERIKDITSIAGIRSNHLIGYGLVVGLDGTGDAAEYTEQSFKNMLNRLGIRLPEGLKPKIKNVAAVVIHADLPPFAKPGQQIDVTVSSIGNAKSLRGGTLLLAPLKAANGKIYAVAQGNLIVGGFDASGADGSRIAVNIPVVGRIPNGAMVERGVPMPYIHGNQLTFNLHRADFTTAKRVADAINQYFGLNTAEPADAGSVHVKVPGNASARINFLATAENLTLMPGEAAARVVINSRTGTIVIGKHVKVHPAAVTHGNLTVTITETTKVSQPAPLSSGTTIAAPETEIQVEREDNRVFLLQPGVSLDDLVKAINQVGAAPGDLMAIMEALKQSGALSADVEII